MEPKRKIKGWCGEAAAPSLPSPTVPYIRAFREHPARVKIVLTRDLTSRGFPKSEQAFGQPLQADMLLDTGLTGDRTASSQRIVDRCFPAISSSGRAVRNARVLLQAGSTSFLSKLWFALQGFRNSEKTGKEKGHACRESTSRFHAGMTGFWTAGKKNWGQPANLGEAQPPI